MTIRYEGMFGNIEIGGGDLSWPWPLTSDGFYTCQGCGLQHRLGEACHLTGQPATLPPLLGWECPRCHGCFAPTVRECERCAPKGTTP